jgi:diadenosine tetraphosphatase ApaH/serine/threonine PP2A family protein phosphatase
METEYFNQYAAESMGWTKNSISQKTIEIMSDFQLSYELENILLVHASPKEPGMWHYILDVEDAKESFEFFAQQLCLVGHTHRPYIVSIDDSEDFRLSKDSEEIAETNRRYLINIGSVGQPRDGDPRSCYLIYDSETKMIKHKRVNYNIKATQKHMARLGLPEYLIERLAIGK